MQGLSANGPEYRLAVLTAVLIAPSYLNDFFFVILSPSESVFLVDYTTRLIVISVLLTVPEFRGYVREAFPSWRAKFDAWSGAIAALVILTFLCVAVFRLGKFYIERPLYFRFPETQLFVFPKITTPWLRWFDFTVGLTVVAVSEELTNRVVLNRVLERWGCSAVTIVVISALLFSLGHWSNGVGAMVNAAVIGAVFMVIYMKLGSILPMITAHYAVDFLVFF